MAAFVLLAIATSIVPDSGEKEEIVEELPEEQGKFLEVVARAKTDFHASPNELSAGRVLVARDARLAEWATISRWRGRVLGVNEMQGKAAFGIDVGGVELVAGVHLMRGLDTLVSPRSRTVYDGISARRSGDEVEVSGGFLIDEGALVEISYSDSGSASSPRFLFAFEHVSPVSD